MPSPSPRLLCAGNELELLQTRCAVLALAGYDAKAATLPEAETLARTGGYDLVIISAWLTDWERDSLLSAAGKTPAYVLTELTPAEKLLAEVARLLTGNS
jgi:hypothetical protein